MADAPFPLPLNPAAMQQALTQMPAPAGGGTPSQTENPVPPGMTPSPAGGLMPSQAPPPTDVNLGSSDAKPQGPKGPPSQNQFQVPAIVNLFHQLLGDQAARGYVGGTGSPGEAGAQPARPVSRLDAFEGFLGNFLNSFSQGMAQGGTGPGANARGFGIAMQAPYQRELQQYGLQQQQQAQQAQVGLQQAEAARTQAQAQMVPVQPYGPTGPTIYMSAEQAKPIMTAQVAAQGKVAAAGVARYKQGPLGVLDTQTGSLVGGTGPGGVSALTTVTPQLAQQYDIPQEKVGTKITNSVLLGFMNAKARRETIAQGSEGPYMIDKTGQTPPQNLGIGSPAANPLAKAKYELSRQVFMRDTFGTYFGKSIPSSLVDSEGNTIGWKSPSAPTASIKQQAQQAEDLGTLFGDVRTELAKANQQGLIGPESGRVNEFMTGTIGADNPEFAKLRALGSLTASGMLKSHFGARGGQDMYNHFESLFNTGQMSYGDLMGALDGFQVFMNQYAGRVKTAGTQGGGSTPKSKAGGAPTAEDMIKKYPPAPR